jgi:preprotein translocase subunit SecY
MYSVVSFVLIMLASRIPVCFQSNWSVIIPPISSCVLSNFLDCLVMLLGSMTTLLSLEILVYVLLAYAQGMMFCILQT